MEIVFVRHGQTDVNKANRLQGSNVDAPLNEAGRSYAKKAAENFDPSPFDVVFVSPLKRAVETAQIFTKGQKKLQRDQRLIEYDFGDWDGKEVDQLVAKHPDIIDSWGKINQNYLKYVKNWESYQDFEQRCADFLNDVQQQYGDQKVLVVAHGRLIRMMTAHYLCGGNLEYLDTIDNCSLTKFSVRDGLARLVYYNRLLA